MSANDMEKDLVTVILPSFRMGAFIGTALDSIAAQGHAAWEVVVVDDHGPEDGTRAIVEAFAARVAPRSVRYIRHQVNQGVSAARNTGLAEARGTYVAFLDPDDHWLPDHLDRTLDLFQRHLGLDVATGPVEIVEANGSKRISALDVWHRRHFPHTLGLYNFIQPSSTVIRRSAVEAVGGFDTDPAIQHIEDYDLWIRLVERGSRFAFLDTPTSRYLRHEQGATADNERMRRLDAYLVGKHPGFFRRSQAWLQRSMLKEQQRMDNELIELRTVMNGPTMRILRAIDGALRAVIRTVRSGGR